MTRILAAVFTAISAFVQIVLVGIPWGVGIAIGAGTVVILALKFITWRSNQPKGAA